MIPSGIPSEILFKNISKDILKKFIQEIFRRMLENSLSMRKFFWKLLIEFMKKSKDILIFFLHYRGFQFQLIK